MPGKRPADGAQGRDLSGAPTDQKKPTHDARNLERGDGAERRGVGQFSARWGLPRQRPNTTPDTATKRATWGVSVVSDVSIDGTVWCDLENCLKGIAFFQTQWIEDITQQASEIGTVP